MSHFSASVEVGHWTLEDLLEQTLLVGQLGFRPRDDRSGSKPNVVSGPADVIGQVCQGERRSEKDLRAELPELPEIRLMIVVLQVDRAQYELMPEISPKRS